MRLLYHLTQGSLAATLLLGLAFRASAQSVGIGTPTPNSQAALDISASDKGLLIPRMDSATRVHISSPPDGLMVFQTNGRKGFWYAISGAWVFIPDKARAGDNLGNHTATQDLNLNGHQLTGGGTQGLSIASDGSVGIRTAASQAQPLAVAAKRPLLDQEQASTTGRYVNHFVRTQSFVAGLNGELAAVALRFSIDAGGASAITLTISAGDPATGCATGPALATTTLTTTINGWATASFSVPPAMVVGNVYALTVSDAYNWCLSANTNAYPAGLICGFPTIDGAFRTYVTTDVQVFSVTTTGVGVNTVTPTTDLDVNGTTRTTSLQVTTGAATGRVLTSDASGTATWQAVADPSATNELQTISKTGSTITLSNGGGSVTVPGDNLGSHMATQDLDLAQQELRLRTATDANHALFYSASWNGTALDGPVLTGYGGGQLGLNRNGTLASVLRWNGAGLVGIGTAAPAALLDVSGAETSLNGRAAAIRLQNTAATTTNTWSLRAGGPGTATPDGGFSLADDNGYRFGITSGGLVGINILTPTARLTVSGADNTANGKNAAILLQNTSATVANTWNLRAGGAGTTTPDGGFSIADNSAYRLTVTSTGRVGIGTTSPAQMLDVAGNLRLAGQSGTTEGLLVADAQGDVQRARHYSYTNYGLLGLSYDTFTETHNLGYKPVWLMSIESAYDTPKLTVSYENIDANQTVFHIFNNALLPVGYALHAFPVR